MNRHYRQTTHFIINKTVYHKNLLLSTPRLNDALKAANLKQKTGFLRPAFSFLKIYSR